MSMIKINIQDVSFAYPHKALFHGLSLEISNEKKTTLLAPNGAGKSTLIHLAAKMITPDQGDIKILKDDCEISTPIFHKTSGHTLSCNYLLQDFTVAENFTMYGAFYKNFDQKHLDMLIESFRLEHVLHRKCKFLSQGELKKVSIVKALMHMPDFLFLDEPTNGLDDRAKDVLSDYLKTLDGLVLIASHDRSWASDIATRILTIDKGGVHAL